MNNLTLPRHAPLASVVLLSLITLGCTDDVSTSDPSDAAARPDATVSVEAGTQPDSGGTDKDSGADAGDAAADAARVVYEGAPSCDELGLRLQGTINGKPVDDTVPRYQSSIGSEGISSYLNNVSDGGPLMNLRLTWDRVPGPGEVLSVAPGGVVVSPATTVGAVSYCVEAGEVGLAPMQPTRGARMLFRITQVKLDTGSSCEGPVLAADLRGCVLSDQKL